MLPTKPPVKPYKKSAHATHGNPWTFEVGVYFSTLQ